MKKLNKYHEAGLFFIAVSLLSNGIDPMPDFIKGFSIGLGIVFTMIGLYAYNHDISKFRKFKIDLVKKCFGR